MRLPGKFFQNRSLLLNKFSYQVSELLIQIWNGDWHLHRLKDYLPLFAIQVHFYLGALMNIQIFQGFARQGDHDTVASTEYFT